MGAEKLTVSHPTLHLANDYIMEQAHTILYNLDISIHIEFTVIIDDIYSDYSCKSISYRH